MQITSMKTKRIKQLLSKKEPEKRLLLPLKKNAGRSNTGRITVRHKGGGVKRLYRIINFGQEKIDKSAVVKSIEYDPNRTCFIALLQYNDGDKGYILAPDGLRVEDEVICAADAPIKVANRLKLKNIPVGGIVHNVELELGRGGKICRSAGTSVVVMGHEEKYSQAKMPSGEIRKVLGECFASVGNLSNPEHRFHKLTKAGTSRLKGRRPTVRGSAMNACDHPHGGGKNKQPIGLKHPKTPWGKPALGVKTRKKSWTDKLILERRKK